MIEDMMPTPCACCNGVTDFRNLVSDPLEEYDMVCTVCAEDREETEHFIKDAEQFIKWHEQNNS